MLDMTPAERRGALVLLALALLGAAWDLTHLRPHMAQPATAEAGGSAAPLAAGTPNAVGAGGVGAFPVDLNAASASELDALPGIGPVLASRIVERRAALGRFVNPEELLSVRGIGPRLFERLRPLVTCGVAGRTSPGHPLQHAR